MTRLTTALALQEMTDHVAFEEMVSQLLARNVDRHITPIGGGADRHRDAVRGLFRYGEGEEGICSISLREDAERKIREEIAGVREEGWTTKEMIAVTSEPISNDAIERLQEVAGKVGIDLTVYGRKVLVHWLELPLNLDLRQEYLHLPPPRHPFFLDKVEFARLLAQAGTDLDTPFVGRESDTLALVEALAAGSPVVLLDGDGGIGKSRLAIEVSKLSGGATDWLFVPAGQPFENDMVSELGAGKDVLVVIDDAHRRDDLRTVADALRRRNPPASILLLARPGFRDKIVANLDGLFATAPKAFELTPLRRPEVVAILRSPPFSIDREGLLSLIVHIAAGNPQLAGIAGALAAKGEKLDALDRDEIFQRYARSVIQTAANGSRDREELLAIIAAVRTLNPDAEDVTSAVEELTGLRPVDLRREIQGLADSGPVNERGGLYMIKPDVLSEQILRHSFFDPARSPLIEYARVYEAFAPLGRSPLLEALGAAGVPADAENRLETVRLDVLRRVDRVSEASAATYSRFARALAPRLPMFALQIVDALLERLPSLGDEAADEVGVELVGSISHVSYIDLAWRRLMRLGGLIFTRPTARAETQWIEAVTTIYRRLPFDTYGDEGRVLAIVQQATRNESRAFWDGSDQGRAAAKTASYAARALMTLGFDNYRSSAEDPNTLHIGHSMLPASQFTREAFAEGARLFRMSFPLLTPREQVEQIDALDAAVRVACGFEQGFGLTPSAELRAFSREMLSTEIEPWLAKSLEGFTKPVAADALDYFSWRARHDESVSLPDVPDELAEYYALIHPTHHREHGADYHADVARQAEEGRGYAKLLTDAADPGLVLNRWRDWLSEAIDAKGQPPWHPSLQALFDHVGETADRTLVDRLADHLRVEGGQLIFFASGLIRAYLARASEADVARWVESEDANARAALPWALEARPDEEQRGAFEQLAQDPDPGVRKRVWHRLVQTHDESAWRTELLVDLTEVDQPDELAAIARELVEQGADLDPGLAKKIRQKVLASAEADSVSEHAVTEALRQLDALDIDTTFEWIIRRLAWIRAADQRVSYRDMPKDVISLLRERARGECFSQEFDELVRLYDEEDLPHGYRHALAGAIGALGSDSQELTNLFTRWTSEGEAGLDRAYEVIGVPSSFEAFTERARILLRSANTRRTRASIIGAQEQTVFSSGPISDHYSRRADRFRPWLDHDDPLLVELAREAINDMEKAADTHAKREALETDEGW